MSTWQVSFFHVFYLCLVVEPNWIDFIFRLSRKVLLIYIYAMSKANFIKTRIKRNNFLNDLQRVKRSSSEKIKEFTKHQLVTEL